MQKSNKKIILIISIAVGLILDILLRINSGDEGNLLVHSVVILGGTVLSYGLIRLINIFLK